MVQRGLRVQYSSGWDGRGRPYSFSPSVGIIDHHTASTSDIDSVLINGRSDLPGPLCNWALHKDGTWVLIASGYANHAGESQSGAPTNSTGWGVEATGPIPIEATGPGAFPNYDAYVTGMACIMEAENWPTSKIWGHKESCHPSGRKIDPSFDMNSFRSKVAAGGESDLPLNDADKNWIRQTVHDALYHHLLVALSGAGTSVVNTGSYPEYFDGDHPSNQSVINDLRGSS
jgi:hypothetical protein